MLQQLFQKLFTDLKLFPPFTHGKIFKRGEYLAYVGKLLSVTN